MAKKRKRSKSGKGSQFERDVCRQISNWWSGNDRDDLFWRTATSGGRAKRRGRQGKETTGHYGDICACDNLGRAFVKVMLLELKKGYKNSSFADVIDRSDRVNATAQFPFEAMLQQTIESWEQSDSIYWGLLFYRQSREPILFFDVLLYEELKQHGCFTWKPLPFLRFNAVIRTRHKVGKKNKAGETLVVKAVGMRWTQWLSMVTPSVIKKIAKGK